MLKRAWDEFKYKVKWAWDYLTVVEKIILVCVIGFVAISIASVF